LTYLSSFPPISSSLTCSSIITDFSNGRLYFPLIRFSISRQAIHKLVKNLESKGLIQITNSENNHRDKSICLTELGEKCYEKNMALKAVLENKIIDRIGIDQFNILKNILKADWDLEDE